MEYIARPFGYELPFCEMVGATLAVVPINQSITSVRAVLATALSIANTYIAQHIIFFSTFTLYAFRRILVIEKFLNNL